MIALYEGVVGLSMAIDDGADGAALSTNHWTAAVASVVIVWHDRDDKSFNSKSYSVFCVC